MRPSLLRRRGWRVTIRKSLLCFAALIGRFRRLLPSGLAGWVLAGTHPALIWYVFNRRFPFYTCRFRSFASAIVAIPTSGWGRQVTSVSSMSPTIGLRHAVGNTKYGTYLRYQAQHIVFTGVGDPLDQRSSGLGFRGVRARAQSHLTCIGAHNVRPQRSWTPVPDRCGRPVGPMLVPRPIQPANRN